MQKEVFINQILEKIRTDSWKNLSHEAEQKNCILLKSGQDIADIAYLLIHDQSDKLQNLLIEEEVIGIKKKIREEWNKIKNLEFEYLEISPYLILKKKKADQADEESKESEPTET